MIPSDATRVPLLAFALVLLSALFSAPVACGKDVSLGSGSGGPSDASPDQREERAVGGTDFDARPDQSDDMPVLGVGDVRGIPDTPPVAGTDVRPD